MMLRDGRQYMESVPWVAIAAGSSIAVTVLAFNLLGDVIRDVIDPRLRGSR
jgi:peptide/nickel transport system permease protein